MVCPKCGYRFQPFDQYCSRCARLGAAAAPTRPQAGPDQPYKVCPACGQRAVVTMVVCGRCGYVYRPPQGAEQVPVPESPPPTAERTKWPLTVGLLLLVLLLGGGYFMRSGLSPGRGRALSAGSGGASNVLVVGGVPGEEIRQRLLVSGAATGTDLEVSLAWSTLTDLDLQVQEPSGHWVHADAPLSVNGGQQDVDANPTPLTSVGEARFQAGELIGMENTLPIDGIVGMSEGLDAFGAGASRLLNQGESGKAPPRYTRAPVEHMYWRNAPSGGFTVYVSCFCWREPTANPLPYTVEVSSHGRVLYRWTGAVGPRCVVSDGYASVLAGRFTVP